MDNPFKWRHYEPEIILLCVRWYLRYALSCRDSEEIMAERGLMLDHTAILRVLNHDDPPIMRSGILTTTGGEPVTYLGQPLLESDVQFVLQSHVTIVHDVTRVDFGNGFEWAVHITDSNRGEIFVPYSEFEEHFTGRLIVVSP